MAYPGKMMEYLIIFGAKGVLSQAPASILLYRHSAPAVQFRKKSCLKDVMILFELA